MIRLVLLENHNGYYWNALKVSVNVIIQCWLGECF